MSWTCAYFHLHLLLPWTQRNLHILGIQNRLQYTHIYKNSSTRIVCKEFLSQSAKVVSLVEDTRHLLPFLHTRIGLTSEATRTKLLGSLPALLHLYISHITGKFPHKYETWFKYLLIFTPEIRNKSREYHLFYRFPYISFRMGCWGEYLDWRQT